MSSSYNQAGAIVNVSLSAATIGQSTVTSDSFFEEVFLDDEQNKIKVEEVYSDGRLKNEDKYEIIKV